MIDVFAHGSAPGGAASFGFSTVEESARQGLVNGVFARVARRYDIMNDIMSGGMHRLWKADMIAWLSPPRAASARFDLIDVAGGTGDIARACLKASPAARATLVDISAEMLNAGRARTRDHADRLAFAQGNAEALPIPDRRFDAYTIAFGIRNVTHIDRALAEAYRVLKPGGRFLCLEFSEVQVPMLDRLYDAFSFNAIPALGGVVAGDKAAYRYLVESIRRFPDQDTFAQMIGDAGFAQVKYRNLSGGIAALHSGWRI